MLKKKAYHVQRDQSRSQDLGSAAGAAHVLVQSGLPQTPSTKLRILGRLKFHLDQLCTNF